MNNLTYIKCGDYYIPNLTLQEDSREPLGKYGRMRRTYLKEHRPILYSQLILSGELFQHLREIDRTARRRLEIMMTQMLAQDPGPEKEADSMGWAGHQNCLKAQAEEIISAELILS